MRTSDLSVALIVCLFFLLPSSVRGENAYTNDGTRIDPTATHCWTDSDCPRYWTCAGKLGQLGPDGECPLDYSCPSDPGDIRQGACYYKSVACSTNADCPPIADCILNPNDSAGQCVAFVQKQRSAP